MIDRAFFWVRARPFFYRLTLFTRILLAAGFIPTGMVKVMGQRFTMISPESPIGAFFEAMYQTGLYWQFIGLSQVVAAVLLLVPRVAHLGAALFVPIIANILVITISLGFGGTPLVVAPMLLAALYLVAWDYHRFRPVFATSPMEGTIPNHKLDRLEFFGFLAFAICLMNFFGMTRSFIGPETGQYFLVGGFLAGFFTLGRFLWLWSRGGLAPEPA